MSGNISRNSPDRIAWSEKIRDQLVIVLNELHGINLSRRFWTILIEEHIRAVMSRKKLLESEESNRSPDLYPMNGTTVPSIKQRLKTRLKLSLKHLTTRNRRKKIDRQLKSNDIFNIGFSSGVDLEREELGKEIVTYHPLIFGYGEKHKRRKADQIASRYDDICLKNCIKELPAIFVEHFKQLYDSVTLHNAQNKVFHIHTHIQNSNIIYDRMLTAKYAEQGATLIWYQYGSGIGEFEDEYGHYLEHSVADEYRTWGWKIKEKDKPWKSYILEKFQKKYEQCSHERSFDLMLCFPKMYQTYKKDAVDSTKYLLSNLSSDQYSKILARPRPIHKKYSQEFEIKFIDSLSKNEGISVTKGTGLPPVAEDVSKCRLVLQLNVPGTNFLECIHVNHPTMGLFRNENPTEIINPYYKFFLSKGVLHHEIGSLVDQLNTIVIEEWWSEIVNDSIYPEFKQRFAGG